MRYSKTTGGFYPEDRNYPALPGDLVAIEDAYHAELMAAQDAGQIIVAGIDGVPIAVDPPAPDLATQRAGMQMSFAQLLIGLVAEAWITEAEGEAWLAGTLPAAVLSVIAALPPEARFAATARAIRPSVILRTDPLVAALGAAQGTSDAELDAFFIGYALV